MSLQQLEALTKMVPTKEEEAKLADYAGDINELGPAEKFVKLALTIPFAFLRVEAMLYRETFEDEVVHLRNSFSMLEVTDQIAHQISCMLIFILTVRNILKQLMCIETDMVHVGYLNNSIVYPSIIQLYLCPSLILLFIRMPAKNSDQVDFS